MSLTHFRMKTIGIIGSGQVAMALANGFIKHGFSVIIGTRNPHKIEDWKKETGGKGESGNYVEAARKGEIIVLAVPGRVAEDALKTAGIENLSGKTVIDVTNPISTEPPDDGVLKYFTGLDRSLMEQLQELAPKANFVKSFSCVGNPFMVNPQFPEGKPTMFICGNSVEAKREVTQILDLFGWETEDLGSVKSARAIEPLCILWCIPGFLNNQWMHALKLLKMQPLSSQT